MKYTPFDKYPSNLVIILATIGITLSFNIFGSLISIFSDSINFEINVKIIQSISQIVFLFGAAILLSNIIPLKFKTLFRLEENINFKYIFWGVIGLFFLNLFNTGYINLQEYLIPNSLISYYLDYKDFIESLYERILKGRDAYDFVVALLIGAIIPAVSEEFLFRGFGQRSLEENNSAKYSIIVIAIIFGVIHFNLINLIPLFLIGVFLGYLAFTSKNILVPIFIHFLNNAFAILFLYIGEPEIISNENDISMTTSIILTLVGLLGVLAIIRILLQSGNSET